MKFLKILPIVAAIALEPAGLAMELKNWGLQNDLGNSHIHATDAWRVFRSNKKILVAVIDTGIDTSHVDLKDRIFKDKDGNYGWDFTTDQPNPKDEHGHGTHIAGIIGASTNRISGTSGVSPNVIFMPVKYFSEKSSGKQNLKNSISALYYAIKNGADIINYSGGGPEFSMDEYAALKEAEMRGILVIVAAGNEKADINITDNYYYPCSYKLTNIVCVGATTVQNKMLSSSNWGNLFIDVAAPGENIISTIPGNKYGYMSGTSQATAFVSGIAALLLSDNPCLTPQEVKEILRNSVDKIPSLKNKVYSEGKVNAFSSLMFSRKNYNKHSKTCDIGF